MSQAPETRIAPPLAAGPQAAASPVRGPRPWAKYLEWTVAVFLVLFALTLPLSVKGAHHAYEAALILWLVAVVVARKPLMRQPLVAPMLLYLVFSAISTLLSPAPVLSWDRMKIVCLLMICVVFAQNIKSLRQMKWILAALLLGSVVSAGIAGRQMIAGLGVQVQRLPPATPLAQMGLEVGDVVVSVAGRGVRTPEQLQSVVPALPEHTAVKLVAVRFAPFQYQTFMVERSAIVSAGLLEPGAVVPSRPQRALGTFDHYIVYAELLLQLALFTWGLAMAAAQAKHGRLALLLLLCFGAIAAALAVTKTRSALGALLLSALVPVWMSFGRKVRIAFFALFAILLIGATIWIHHSRGLNWIDPHDPGTQYRVALWKDGLRLARTHPWFGVGMESVRVYWHQWNMQAYARFHTQSHFHSNWIQLAAERGFLTLAAWTWFVIAYLVFLLRLVRRARAAGWVAHGVALGALAAMLGFMIESVVQYNLGEQQVVAALWFFAGLAVAVERLVSHDPGPAQETRHTLEETTL